MTVKSMKYLSALFGGDWVASLVLVLNPEGQLGFSLAIKRFQEAVMLYS